jgi:aryl-alcohol dehydrogenase-like predicted oxidoreductase
MSFGMTSAGRRSRSPTIEPALGAAEIRAPNSSGSDTMLTTPLGRTGIKISRLALGTAMLGPAFQPDGGEAIRIIHAGLDAGINFIDTSDSYGFGAAEETVGQALSAGKRDDVILATKVGTPLGEDPNSGGSSRRWIMRAVNDSLRRLRTDWIDLYQVHQPDHDTDIEATLGTLNDLLVQGKIRAFGHSNFPAHTIVEALWAADRRGLERFACEQPPYSMLQRGVEADVLPTCERYGLGVVVWAPLHSGWLSGRYRKGRKLPRSARAQRAPKRFDMTLATNQAKLEAADALAKLADEAGVSLIHLALAFVANHPAVSAPIIGPRTMEHLESQLGAVDLVLNQELLDRVDQIVAPGFDFSLGDVPHPPPSLREPSRRRRAG